MDTGDTNTVVLDLRDVDPVEHHDRLFLAINALAQGEHLRLITHYNPERYLEDLRATHAGQLTWDEHESGTPDWTVVMTRVAQGGSDLLTGQTQQDSVIVPTPPERTSA